MHYEIETVTKNDPLGEIIHSSRRAGNATGKAQAYNLARRLGAESNEHTILITEVHSREDRRITAAFNPNEQLRADFPSLEVVSNKRYNRFIKVATEILEKEVEEKGQDAKAVYEQMKRELESVWEKYGTESDEHDSV